MGQWCTGIQSAKYHASCRHRVSGGVFVGGLGADRGRSEKEQIKSLRVWAVVCLAAMIIGPIGTSLLPKAVFGLFERFSTFSAVVFNAVLGIYLMKGRFTDERIDRTTKTERMITVCEER